MSSFEKIINQINLTSPLHKKFKDNVLNNFLKKNSNLANQGSEEWHAIRKYNIGGSEMSIITGDNPYQKIDELVAQKIGFTKFSGNLATRWGNLFEPITQRITEILFNIDEIKETGSLPGAINNQRYSPDGIGVVKLNCSDNNMETKEYCTVLFEYKAPFTSIPSGSIPNHYIPQVKTGLCSIPFTDFAIFISNMYRKCSFDCLKENKDYDTNFHNKDENKKIMLNNPLSYGMILFYQTDIQKKRFLELYYNSTEYNNVDDYTDDDTDDDTNDDTDDNVNKMDILFDNMNSNRIAESSLNKHLYEQNIKNNKPKDFGKSNYYEFNDLMILVSENLISVKYLEPNILSEYNNNEFIKQQDKEYTINNIENIRTEYKKILSYGYLYENNNKYIISGFLPWKLFKSDIIYQEREHDYINKYKNIINKTINIITKINECSKFDDKIQIFKKNFPNSKVLKNCGFDTSEYMEFIIK